ncbi:polysaccharide lyase [Arenibacter sp. BSSL-BM3]|uniref:Polysaccharide lyase n=1 Tax=Arenibacter arenosicollis TaxID=2762274 RepID=A0ABR7QSH2_9FLAO|nr:polysaccharide lyase [Arenibacter arenosicollis]MBC8769877.1 polysaccharide lyase [Arenibacter arenosicollis]
MKRMIGINVLIFFVGLISNSCNKNSAVPTTSNEKKLFKSSFETIDDFSGFYITPQGHLETTFHELSDSIVHSGIFSHRAWIDGANPPSITENNNHRGYPTIQLKNTLGGSFISPCYITFWVWLDMDLQASTTGGEDDWFSFATFTDDESDNWDRTLLVNLSHDGYVHLQNVPKQNEQEHEFQTSNITFPQKEWVELKVYLDLSNGGYAKVWQNGQLVSHAKIGNMTNKLSQAHFGLYCSPQLRKGTVYNDDLIIKEVDGE